LATVAAPPAIHNRRQILRAHAAPAFLAHPRLDRAEMKEDFHYMNTRILCIGNELVHDDGVGIRIGRILMDLPLPADVRVELAPSLGSICSTPLPVPNASCWWMPCVRAARQARV
jgi:hypothetical protein